MSEWYQIEDVRPQEQLTGSIYTGSFYAIASSDGRFASIRDRNSLVPAYHVHMDPDHDPEEKRKLLDTLVTAAETAFRNQL